MDFPEVIIGNCRLILGDCREVLPILGTVDAVVTDPPYGVSLVTKTSDYRQSRHFDHGVSLRASRLYQDDATTIQGLLASTLPLMLSKCACALIFPGAAMLFEYPKPTGIGGVYTPNGAGCSPWGFQCIHPILFYGKDPYLVQGLGSRPNGFRTEQPNKEKIDHPCPKPLEWMRWAVQRASLPYASILDPFMGSGTTGVACIQLGRSFVGIEIESRYFDIACRRIEDAYKQPDLFIAAPQKPRQLSFTIGEEAMCR